MTAGGDAEQYSLALGNHRTHKHTTSEQAFRIPHLSQSSFVFASIDGTSVAWKVGVVIRRVSLHSNTTHHLCLCQEMAHTPVLGDHRKHIRHRDKDP